MDGLIVISVLKVGIVIAMVTVVVREIARIIHSPMDFLPVGHIKTKGGLWIQSIRIIPSRRKRNRHN